MTAEFVSPKRSSWIGSATANPVWVFTALAGLFAAVVHIPIRDRAAPSAPRPSYC